MVFGPAGAGLVAGVAGALPAVGLFDAVFHTGVATGSELPFEAKLEIAKRSQRPEVLHVLRIRDCFEATVFDNPGGGEGCAGDLKPTLSGYPVKKRFPGAEFAGLRLSQSEGEKAEKEFHGAWP